MRFFPTLKTCVSFSVRLQWRHCLSWWIVRKRSIFKVCVKIKKIYNQFMWPAEWNKTYWTACKTPTNQWATKTLDDLHETRNLNVSLDFNCLLTLHLYTVVQFHNTTKVCCKQILQKLLQETAAKQNVHNLLVILRDRGHKFVTTQKNRITLKT